jgi:hypothetical protein
MCKVLFNPTDALMFQIHRLTAVSQIYITLVLCDKPVGKKQDVNWIELALNTVMNLP